MKKSVVLWLLMIASFQSVGQYDHKDILPGTESEALLNQLISQYKPGQVKTYTEARHFMFREVYNSLDSVETIYAGLKRYLDPQIEDPIQYLLQGSNNMQIDTEHSYPRSKGAARNTDAGSDLHHLFPSRKQINASRGNLPFGEVNDNQTINWYEDDNMQQNIPGNNIDEYSELGPDRFEPRENQKGNIARAIFYFYTMYRQDADREDPQFFELQKQDLCDWHYIDPVDSLEWVRSKMIGSFQGHEANPFVLDCSVAARLYCEEIDDACAFLTSVKTFVNKKFKVYPNPSNNMVILDLGEYNNLDDIKIFLTNQMGKRLKSLKPENTELIIDLSNYPSGVYFLQMIEINKVVGRKRIVKN